MQTEKEITAMSTHMDHLEDQIDQLAQNEKDLVTAERDRKQQRNDLEFNIEIIKVSSTYIIIIFIYRIVL